MPNGGLICCLECAFGRSLDGRCDVHGVQVSAFLLCRSFRMAGQSHTDERQRWSVLAKLEPGVVYEIDNAYPSSGTGPMPRYRLAPI